MKNLKELAHNLAKITEASKELADRIRKIESPTDMILREVVALYSPNQTTGMWWAWGYYDSDDAQPQPQFKPTRNICVADGHTTVSKYYLGASSEDPELDGFDWLSADDSWFELSEDFPAEWLFLTKEEVAQELKAGRQRAIDNIAKQKADLAKKNAAQAKKRAAIIEQAKSKLTREERLALGLKND